MQNNTALAMTRTDPITLQEYYHKAGVTEVFDYAREIFVTPDGNPEYEPWEHQIGDLNQALCHYRLGLYNDPGCMKTLAMQAYMLYWAGLGNKVVVIMPPTLIEQYTTSLHAQYKGFDNFFSYHILNDGPKKRAERFATWREKGWPDILCMSYQMFAKVPRDRKRNGEVIAPAEPDDYIVGVLKTAGYSILVADESHALKNSSSTQHKSVYFFLGETDETSSRGLLATGTPIHNTLMDIYGMSRITSPGKYASKGSFERLHCIYEYNKEGQEKLVGFRNKELMTAVLYANGRRITKEAVFSVTKPHIIEIPITLTKRHKALYDQLVRERFIELGTGEIIDALQAQSLRQKCLQMVTTPQHFTDGKVTNAVIDRLDELIDDTGIWTTKIVLFMNFRRSVEYLRDHYAEYNPAIIYGGKGNNAKEKNKFLTDDSCRLCICQTNSGGVGLNLQSVSHTAIFVEPTSVPGAFKQAMERLRVGHPSQKHVVSIYIIKAMGTSSPKITRDMLAKEKTTLEVTRDRSTLLRELMGG